jgi:tripartite-type tricarboxylate transporter receptor subunit TctC
MRLFSCIKHGVFLFTLIFGVVAHAAWPEDKPIELVVGFAPGGGTDTMARLLARTMEKYLGQNSKVLVINKPGAGGEIAATYLAQSKPDGYTLGMINVPGYVFMPLYKKTGYQPDQIRLIARLVDDPAIIVTSRESKNPKTLPEIIAAAKSSSTSFTVGHSGDGTTGHIALMQLEKLAGIKLSSVPFKGAGEAKLALYGGHLDYAIITTGEAPDLSQPNSKLQGIVQFSRKRGITDLPIASEYGYDIRVSSERGVGAPKAIPNEVALKLEKAIAQSLKDPEFLASAKGDAPVLAYLPGDEWAKQLNASKQLLMQFVPYMQEK